MKSNQSMLTAEQYNALYCKAFAKLDELCTLAEQAMRELEELQLSMGDTDIGRKNFLEKVRFFPLHQEKTMIYYPGV